MLTMIEANHIALAIDEEDLAQSANEEEARRGRLIPADRPMTSSTIHM